MFSTHDFRLPENGAPVCAACYRTTAGPRETACPGSTTVHIGNPALCGSPEGEHGGQPNCILCIAIVEAAPQAPEHDFRAGDGIVACARCGCADADILEFRHCFFRRAPAAPRNDADAWHVVSSPHRALCGEEGEFGWWRRASADKPATCRPCLDAVRACRRSARSTIRGSSTTGRCARRAGWPPPRSPASAPPATAACSSRPSSGSAATAGAR